MFSIRKDIEDACRQADESNRRADELLARIDAKKERQLVYKTYESSQERGTAMDAKNEAAWNAWFQASFDQRMRSIWKDAVAEFVSDYVDKKLSEFGDEILGFCDDIIEEAEKERKLMKDHVAEQVGSLRADLTTLQSIVKGEVAPLIRKAKDDAA